MEKENTILSASLAVTCASLADVVRDGYAQAYFSIGLRNILRIGK